MSDEEREVLRTKWLRKSAESFKVAEELRINHPTFSVNRYYYAVYYSLLAALTIHDNYPKSHKGAISEFSRLFVADGQFSREDSKLIAKTFQWRTKGDYDNDQEYSTEEVDTIRQPVADLLSKIREHPR